jgi:uncharacterized protein YndB with AHSA1/START domain
MSTAMSSGARRTVIFERVFEASMEEVWDLWTTKEGIESWWGPDGFSVRVQKLDLRPGGELLYTMTAIAPDQIGFLKNAGMPLTQAARITYTEVAPPRRLAYRQVADFIPGVAPYDVAHLLEIHPTQGGARMVLTIESMHDEHWTNMAVMGWESELARLADVLRTRHRA